MNDVVKFTLDEARLPRHWYNLAADLPVPLPPVLHPGTLQPIGPADLAPLFPMPLILQEVSTEREIEIPEPVRDVYRQWRPTPLFRARRLERALQTPAKIYYKYEGVSPPGPVVGPPFPPPASPPRVMRGNRLTRPGRSQAGCSALSANGLRSRVWSLRSSEHPSSSFSISAK